MRLYRTSVKEDLNVSGVFQHLAENYVNKVKSFTDSNNSGYGMGCQIFKIEIKNLCNGEASKIGQHFKISKSQKQNTKFSHHQNIWLFLP